MCAPFQVAMFSNSVSQALVTWGLLSPITRKVSCATWNQDVKDQSHIFSKCFPVRSKIKTYELATHENIFGPLYEQASTISNLLKIETIRNHLKTGGLGTWGVCQKAVKVGEHHQKQVKKSTHTNRLEFCSLCMYSKNFWLTPQLQSLKAVPSSVF